MDLANTEIEIRERSLAQRVDLTFRFLAARWVGIATYAAVGVIPAMIGNALLLWVLDPEQVWLQIEWKMAWAMLLYLVWIESPLVMAPLVLYLGATLFRQPLRLSVLLRDMQPRFWRQIWVHGVVRTQLLWLTLAGGSYAGYSSGWCWLAIVVGLLCSGAFSMCRPYIDQIIYLERLPLRAKKGYPSNIRQRSRLLHHANGAGVGNEGVVALLLSGSVFYATYALLLWSYYWLTFNTVTQHWFNVTLFAGALWLVLVVTTVFRFLGYLDSRIRAEGWELELRVKREAQQRAALTARGPRPVASNATTAEASRETVA